MTVVHYEHADGCAVITLDNPPQNRINGAVGAGLTAAITDLLGRDDTRVVVLRAEGPNFSFGGDITAWPGQSEEEFSTGIGQGLALMNAFQDLSVPIVAAVQGNCSGGGYELVLRADIIVAEKSASFAHSEATIGVFTFMGGVQRVAERVGRTRAAQWAMTAESVPAPQALEAGLINEVVPDGTLADATRSWVERFSGGATLAHAAHKKLLRAWSAGGIAAADELMPGMSGEILHSSDAQASIPGAIEALEKGQPRPDFPFEGR